MNSSIQPLELVKHATPQRKRLLWFLFVAVLLISAAPPAVTERKLLTSFIFGFSLQLFVGSGWTKRVEVVPPVSCQQGVFSFFFFFLCVCLRWLLSSSAAVWFISQFTRILLAIVPLAGYLAVIELLAANRTCGSALARATIFSCRW